MSRARRAAPLLPLLVTALVPALAAAQPPPGAPPGPRVWNHVRFAGDREVRVRTAWQSSSPGAEAEVTLRVAGRPGQLELHRGPAIVTDVAADGDRVLVAMSEMAPGGSLHLALVEVPADGPPRVVARRRARIGERRWTPTAVATTATPDGFAVLWQAQSFQGRGRGGQARTLLARVGEDGGWSRRPSTVPVPWAIAGLVWNGGGYHLALYYDGSQPNQTRLCMVTLTEAGQPEQHPWWASRPGMVDEVQLVRDGEQILAVYRGGPSGMQLLSRDVRPVGAWGQDVGAATDRGRIGADEEFALRVDGGAVQVVRRDDAELSR